MTRGSTQTNTLRHGFTLSLMIVVNLAFHPAAFAVSEEDLYSQELSTAKPPSPTPPEEAAPRPLSEIAPPTGPETVTPERPTEQLEKSEASPATKNFWVGFGSGMPLSKFKMPTMHYDLGFSFIIGEIFEIGPLIRMTSATYEDTVTFSATGYNEIRTYAVTAYMLAARLKFHLGTHLSLIAGVGPSITNSNLTSVTTTAPVASTLKPGYGSTTPTEFGFFLSAEYEWRLRAFGFSLDGGYSMTSSNSASGIQEVFLTGNLRYYL